MRHASTVLHFTLNLHEVAAGIYSVWLDTLCVGMIDSLSTCWRWRDELNTYKGLGLQLRAKIDGFIDQALVQIRDPHALARRQADHG